MLKNIKIIFDTTIYNKIIYL